MTAYGTKWLVIGMLLYMATGAHAKDQTVEQWLLNKNLDFKSTWTDNLYTYNEATLANAPPWMKYNCHKREHRWAAWRHRYSMCR